MNTCRPPVALGYVSEMDLYIILLCQCKLNRPVNNCEEDEDLKAGPDVGLLFRDLFYPIYISRLSPS